ncbi:MAG: type IV pilus twitching motility protein PilT [Legionella sp.]|nr:type IV pilus twitching motility protein PilT [Legionella sp.]
MNITELLALAIKKNSSDLHLSAGSSPMIRVDGSLEKLNAITLQHQEVIKLIHDIMTDKQRQEFDEHLETDFAFEIAALGRFRVNVFTQARGVSAVFRIIRSTLLTMDDLGLPPIFKEIASFPRGLVLITGPTGSGKSTTLAAMIDYINCTRCHHIITIEDPVEFIHVSKKCLINQRQVFRDTLGFDVALRSVLREDPDIILVGELRCLKTIRLAMTAAETGHLVFGTLHTNSATKAINRIIDVFPGNEKAMIRSMLSESLQAVVAQTLLKKTGGGRQAALEIMIGNLAIRNLIREDKVAQMYSVLQTGQAHGMQTLDQHLTQLVKQNLIARHTARDVAMNKTLFE